MKQRGAAFLGLFAVLADCRKVPLHDVGAAFDLADATWFEEEETLFIFYQVSAEQGLGEPSVIEITYATDDERVDWTPVEEFETVHIHEPVDCGARSLCGSTSIHVPLQPREVDIRLRYHREGELALPASPLFNVVRVGDPWNHRSFVAYGVFDETNQRVQWRGRHHFPNLRNEQVEAFGLRRQLTISDQTYGTAALDSADNPYAYGVDCPARFEDAGLDPVETTDRAVFHPDPLPLGASDQSVVCAQSTVTDATGTFTTGAVARKNPEVRPAFPLLRSPIEDATPVTFFLAPCDRVISEDHEQMQRQRLLAEDVPTTCIDDWDRPGFADYLAELFTDAVESERRAGNDMVLVIGLNQDEDGVAEVLEDALVQIVPEERQRSSPRLAGAFVFDSDIRGLKTDELNPVTLWCPASTTSTTTSITCAIAPDSQDIVLGPFSFGMLPILPSRDLYLDFIDTYSKAQAGEVTAQAFRVPTFATTSGHVDLGEFGSITFLNDEFISADRDDAFSYCVGEDFLPVFFSSPFLHSEEFLSMIEAKCSKGFLDESTCETLQAGVLPLEMLPEWHSMLSEDTYDLGLFWDFPFLLQMDYEFILAGAVSAFGLSVPFGLGQDGESYVGSYMWLQDEFSLEKELTQCGRYCDHPTFDSAGVYHVTDAFRQAYATSCYLPLYPEPGDSGFPPDP